MRHSICRGRRAHPYLRTLATGAAIAVVIMPVSAFAGPPGCKGITKGSLDVALPAGQRSSRMVRLNAGETINFSVHGGASVSLVSGGDAPHKLSASNGMTSYVSPSTATYVFAIEAGSDSMTSVSANCSQPVVTASADPAPAGTASTPPAKEVEVAQFTTDMDGTRGSAFSLGLSEFAAAAEASRAPVDKWADAADTTAAAIDTAEGVEAASAATLSLSANAEVGPDDVASVLDRMQRVAPSATPAEHEAYLAMASAEVDADMTFEAAAAALSRPSARVVAKVERQEASPEELWVTHVHEDRTPESAVTETAVLRRDTVAAASTLPPPMALGGLVQGEPAADGSAWPSFGFAQ